MVDVTDFKDAMAKLTTAVHVVTTDGVAGRHGFTASAVCSVTDSPPTLLVCMNTKIGFYDNFRKNGVLMVNTLTAKQSNLSNIFASRLNSDERFTHGSWGVLTTGAPLLTDALIGFDCHIKEVKEVGTHGVLICEIVDIKRNDDDALTYFNRSYHRTSGDTAII
ncbi:flavin reductase [Moraxella sp. Tifton1]|uniref:Flavin reductase n=1 Tax=Moraxella oculi TaxID=2940516 RepID=A0ABW8U3L4_9GAMM|nr:flavin reductase [Moraxella sp. Tifton1]MCL1622838.1 flavin reductase [Moraxella sp. Tifton1]